MPSEWEKIIANETTDKELISKIYKQFIQLNTIKTNNPFSLLAPEVSTYQIHIIYTGYLGETLGQ